MRRFQDHRRSNARFERLLPAFHAEAPPIARQQAGKTKMRRRRGKIVSACSTEGQKLRGHLGAYDVNPDILAAGIAATVTKKTGQRIGAARFERAIQYVACLSHDWNRVLAN